MIFLSLIIENDGWSREKKSQIVFLFFFCFMTRQCVWTDLQIEQEKEEGMMFIHHPLISFVVVRSLRIEKKEQWHGSLLFLSLFAATGQGWRTVVDKKERREKKHERQPTVKRK